MKNMRSLVAAFTFVAGFFGVQSAQSQTVPINPQQTETTYDNDTNSSVVSQAAISELANELGVETAYYRAGVGFSSGVASTGEYVGLEFQLNGDMGTVVRAYNLSIPEVAEQYERIKQRAADFDYSLSTNYSYQNGYQEYPRYNVIIPVFNQPMYLSNPGWGWGVPEYCPSWDQPYNGSYYNNDNNNYHNQYNQGGNNHHYSPSHGPRGGGRR